MQLLGMGRLFAKRYLFTILPEPLIFLELMFSICMSLIQKIDDVCSLLS